MGIHVIPQHDYYLEVSGGTSDSHSVIHKFGYNPLVSTTFVPVSAGGVYRTPQAGSATALRVKAGNANDTSDGSGARTITLEGIDASGDIVTETISTNGASAGTASSASFIRLYRAFVASSGTYATQSAGSHAADVVIENAAGTKNWATINVNDFPKGESEIGAYTVPNGYRAFIKNIFVYVDSNKTATATLFQKQNILETSAPYTAMREVYTAVGINGALTIPRSMPLGPFPANTDIGFMAKTTSSTAAVSINFDILLETI